MSTNGTDESESVATRLRTPSGGVVEAHVESVDARRRGVVAAFRLPWAAFERATENGLFHLDGVEAPTTFEASRAVVVEARPRSTFVRGQSGRASAGAVGERVTDPEPGDPLCSTEAWVAIRLRQVSAELDAGARGGDESRVVDLDPRWIGRGSGRRDDSVLQAVVGFLDAGGWAYDVVDGEHLVVRFEADLDGRRGWPVAAYVDETARSCVLYSFHPVRVPSRFRAGAALALAASNCELSRGAFELDPADGLVSFRTRVVPDAEPFGDALYAHLRTVAEEYGTIARLADGGTASDGARDESAGRTAPATDEVPDRAGQPAYDGADPYGFGEREKPSDGGDGHPDEVDDAPSGTDGGPRGTGGVER